MASTTPTDEQKKALDEFEAIRRILRVPFPDDTKDLASQNNPNPEIPEERRWKGLCLGYTGYSGPVVTIAAQAQAEKPRTEKKT